MLNPYFVKAFAQTPVASKNMQVYSIRLEPGDDLKKSLDAFITANHIEAGFIMTGVGSLTHVHLRMANQEQGERYTGHFEIVSLVGTLAVHGSHLHASVSDSTGRTIGGHLLEGNLIYTTAELVLGVLPDVKYLREPCPKSGYNELKVYKKEE
ncbi:DNA-binding protein [Telluribacter humicola]